MSMWHQERTVVSFKREDKVILIFCGEQYWSLAYCHLYDVQYGEVVQRTSILPRNTLCEFKLKAALYSESLCLLMPASSVETCWRWWIGEYSLNIVWLLITGSVTPYRYLGSSVCLDCVVSDTLRSFFEWSTAVPVIPRRFVRSLPHWGHIFCCILFLVLEFGFFLLCEQ